MSYVPVEVVLGDPCAFRMVGVAMAAAAASPKLRRERWWFDLADDVRAVPDKALRLLAKKRIVFPSGCMVCCVLKFHALFGEIF